MSRYGRRKNTAAKVLATVLALIAAAAFYLIVDRAVSSDRIAAIGSLSYAPYAAQKGAQFSFRGVPVSEEPEQEPSSGKVYRTPSGFSIVSYSGKWTGKKLADVYEELMKNVHGGEIGYVSQVAIYPGGSGIDSGEFKVAGTQQMNEESFSVFFEVPALIPQSMRYNLSREASVISLYNMDKYASAAEAAHTIAHEYGHHYTMYYFLKNDEEALTSRYYRLRGFSSFGHPAIYNDQDSYYENHQWDIYEIAAEDYAQLMGSPNAKRVREYKDVKQVLNSGREYKLRADANTANVFPQENIYIPLAYEVEGLRDYFYSFIGKENDLPYVGRADIKIRMSRHSSNGYAYYVITWTKPSTDKNAVYTLVCYDKDGNVFRPVKTIRGNENPSAVVGTASRINGMLLQWLPDHIPDEDRLFKVYLVLPDGQMQSSEIFRADF